MYVKSQVLTAISLGSTLLPPASPNVNLWGCKGVALVFIARFSAAWLCMVLSAVGRLCITAGLP
jgi:hypothetical protein